MINLLVYTDGKKRSESALHFAAALTHRLSGELSVITVRPGTHAAEDPPPVGVPFEIKERSMVSHGLNILIDAAEVLSGRGLFEMPGSVTIQDMPHGHMFVCKSGADRRVSFYECFGGFVETLNDLVDKKACDLLIIAPTRRGRIQRMMVGDTTRKLLLDLHTSLLVVRRGGPDSRFVACADGRLSSRRLFPLLQRLLPAIQMPVDMICVKKPDADAGNVRKAEECMRYAEAWLEKCGRKGTVHLLEGQDRAQLIMEAAGDGSVIVMGASLRHDVLRRMLGSLPMRVLARSECSVLVAKLPPEADSDFLKDPAACR
jgi:nucleotide-binding universal stress UspA family protein